MANGGYSHEPDSYKSYGDERIKYLYSKKYLNRLK